MKIAILSNTNIDYITRMLKKKVDIFDGEGYGNEIGTLINKSSNLYEYNPNTIFLIEDLSRVINNEYDINIIKERIDSWFNLFKNSINDVITYYISDGFLYGIDYDVNIDKSVRSLITNIWDNNLYNLLKEKQNIRIFPLKSFIEKNGVINSFNDANWYQGKILYTLDFQKKLAEEILNIIDTIERVPKKVLLLDLDNTIWGGLAGEEGVEGIVLSQDGMGEVYRRLQMVIKQMKNNGVILGIVSKNNYEDAMAVINKNKNMILKENDFAIKKINWEPKYKNIIEIAEELNIGLDSIVLFDDSQVERESVKQVLNKVEVPDFPKNIEDLPNVMYEIFKKYFDKPIITLEDKEKTDLYIDNIKREKLKNKSISFDDYLKDLKIVLKKVDINSNITRINQLLNKSNQFNLTTIRHTENDLINIINGKSRKVLAYDVSDIYGDNGICVIVVLTLNNEELSIDEFVMSCRVMGRRIEYGVLSDIESFAKDNNIKIIKSRYIKTEKNKPVEDLYDKASYKLKDNKNGIKNYEKLLNEENKKLEFTLNII